MYNVPYDDFSLPNIRPYQNNSTLKATLDTPRVAVNIWTTNIHSSQIIEAKGQNMTKIAEEKRARDHYKASLENGSLVMKPYCACGNSLDEDYFCEKCDRRCSCNDILCDTEATLALVKEYIKRSSQFSAFRAKVAPEA